MAKGEQEGPSTSNPATTSNASIPFWPASLLSPETPSNSLIKTAECNNPKEREKQEKCHVLLRG